MIMPHHLQSYISQKTNKLKLNDRKRFVNENTTCELCKTGEEHFEHFLLVCGKLSAIRISIPELQPRPYSSSNREQSPFNKPFLKLVITG